MSRVKQVTAPACGHGQIYRHAAQEAKVERYTVLVRHCERLQPRLVDDNKGIVYEYNADVIIIY